MYSAGIPQKLLLTSQDLALIWHYQRTQSEIHLTRPDIKEISAMFLRDRALWMPFYWQLFRRTLVLIFLKGIQEIFKECLILQPFLAAEIHRVVTFCLSSWWYAKYKGCHLITFQGKWPLLWKVKGIFRKPKALFSNSISLKSNSSYKHAAFSNYTEFDNY